MKNQIRQENITQNIVNQYQRIGVLVFATGAVLSGLGEVELIAIMFKLPLTVVPEIISSEITLFSAVFYVILGNVTMLVEYLFFRKGAWAEQHGLTVSGTYTTSGS